MIIMWRRSSRTCIEDLRKVMHIEIAEHEDHDHCHEGME